ncbi:MAG: PAS domain-containing protein, partial [Candidatus Aminicenantaceae bacterium]
MANEGEITKEFLESILENMEGGVLTMGKDARITFFNRSAEEISGYTKEEALNKHCCEILKSEVCEES